MLILKTIKTYEEIDCILIEEKIVKICKELKKSERLPIGLIFFSSSKKLLNGSHSYGGRKKLTEAFQHPLATIVRFTNMIGCCLD